MARARMTSTVIDLPSTASDAEIAATKKTHLGMGWTLKKQWTGADKIHFLFYKVLTN